MLKILQKLDRVGKSQLNESCESCSDMSMMPAKPATSNPVSINITGDAASMADILKALSGVQSASTAPVAATREPMDTAFQDDPTIPGLDDVDGDTDLKAGFMGTIGGAIAGGAVGGIPGAIGGGIAGSAAQDALGGAVKKMGEENKPNYDASTSPDEMYADTDMMINTMSGGLNGKKKMFKPAASGDSPMATEMRQRLRAALAEKKDNPTAKKKYKDKQTNETKSSKPDFLDLDNDGDKKEPMKKAVANKSSKPTKGKVPPQFAKKEAVKESADFLRMKQFLKRLNG